MSHALHEVYIYMHDVSPLLVCKIKARDLWLCLVSTTQCESGVLPLATLQYKQVVCYRVCHARGGCSVDTYNTYIHIHTYTILDTLTHNLPSVSLL